MKIYLKTIFYFCLFLTLVSCGSQTAKKESDITLDGTLSFRLMSYNILSDFVGKSWEKRGSTVIGMLQSNKADIIAIQEATELQIASLQRNLDNYYCFVGDRSDGHRNDQKWYEYVPVFYNKDRFNLLQKSSFWVSEDPTKPGGTIEGSRWHGRSLAWVKLQDKKTQKVLYVFNTHIHPEKAEESVRVVRKKILSIAAGNPIILLGDFNMSPDSEAYNLVVENSENQKSTFSDSFLISKKRTGPEGTYGKENKRIDYIFLQGEFNVSEYKVLTDRTQTGEAPSDHNPVLVDLELKLK